MKASWVLAGLLLSVLVVREAPTRSVRVEPALTPVGLIEQVKDALSEKQVTAAVRASDATYRAAVANQRWKDLIEAGDAYRRIGEVAGLPEAFDAKARDAYRFALARARHEQSLDGVLRVGEALATLGDRDGIAESVRIAERLAGSDADAQADIRAFTHRFADQLGPKGE